MFVQAVLFCQDYQHCLRALIVSDVPETEIYVASTTDVARMRDVLAFVAAQTDLRFKPTIVQSNDLSKKKLRSWLKTIHESSADVAFFYYSGRGYNTRGSKWPSITIKKGMQLAERAVAKKIKSCKPKLGIVVFDCYSRPVFPKDSIDFSFIRTKEMSGAMPGLRNIFRANRGMIMLCSSPEVKKALCSTQRQPIGGLFTSNFIGGILTYGRNKFANWNNVGVYIAMASQNANININYCPLIEDHAASKYGPLIKR
jgi:hypothetical protein